MFFVVEPEDFKCFSASLCLLDLLEEAWVVGKVRPITTTINMEVNIRDADVVLCMI